MESVNSVIIRATFLDSITISSRLILKLLKQYIVCISFNNITVEFWEDLLHYSAVDSKDTTPCFCRIFDNEHLNREVFNRRFIRNHFFLCDLVGRIVAPPPRPGMSSNFGLERAIYKGSELNKEVSSALDSASPETAVSPVTSAI